MLLAPKMRATDVCSHTPALKWVLEIQTYVFMFVQQMFLSTELPLKFLDFLFLHNQYYIQESKCGAGEMVQQLRALTALPGDLGSIPSTHMAVHNCL